MMLLTPAAKMHSLNNGKVVQRHIAHSIHMPGSRAIVLCAAAEQLINQHAMAFMNA
jgi:hypothetical protein